MKKYVLFITLFFLPTFALAQDDPAICYMATGASNSQVNGTYVFDGIRDSTCDGPVTAGTAGVWVNENGAEAFVVGDGPYPTPSYFLKFEGAGCFGGYYNHNGIGFAGQTYGNGGDGGTGPTVTEVSCPAPPGPDTPPFDPLDLGFFATTTSTTTQAVAYLLAEYRNLLWWIFIIAALLGLFHRGIKYLP